MLRLQCSDFRKGFFPLTQCLFRQGKHQIYINIIETCFSGAGKIFQKLLTGMDSAQSLQQFILPRLHTHAQTIESHLTQINTFFQTQCTRIGFGGDFRVTFHIETSKNGIQNPLQLLSRKHRRRTAAKNTVLIFQSFARWLLASISRHKAAVYRSYSFSCPPKDGKSQYRHFCTQNGI